MDRMEEAVLELTRDMEMATRVLVQAVTKRTVLFLREEGTLQNWDAKDVLHVVHTQTVTGPLRPRPNNRKNYRHRDWTSAAKTQKSRMLSKCFKRT